MAKMPPESISGYVTGEGCFYVESKYDKKYRLRHRIRPAFCIEVRENDREILEAIKETLGCGNLYRLDFGRYKGYETKRWKSHVKLRISNFDDISKKVVPFFERYPLFGSKQKSFKIFNEIVKKMQRSEHLKEETLEEIKSLVKTLNSLNKKGM